MTEHIAGRAGPDVLKASSRTLLIEGIVLVAIGTFAIVVPGIFTYLIETLIGVVLIVTGAMRLWRCFRAQAARGFWDVVAAVVALAAGVLLIAYPLGGMLTLTALVVALLLLEGAAKTVGALQVRERRGWVWMLVSGVVDLALGLLLWLGLPETAMWAIGLLVGISLLFTGWTAIMLAAGLSVMVKEPGA